MKFISKLQEAKLVRRYKRFLADIEHPDGSVTTIHCPNSGSMMGCAKPGSLVRYSTSDNLKRKYPHTLEMVKSKGIWVGVNTSLTNRIVAEAFLAGKIEGYRDFSELKHEVKISERSRLDLMLKYESGKKTYIEIKNCSLVEDGWAQFPDAVTTRGTKHLNELQKLVKQGHEAMIFFLVQRSDGKKFKPAFQIDPIYGQTLKQVVRSGVKVLVYQARVSKVGISVSGQLPFSLD
ncbi:MAG: DNA/RNA nuclease SfsA [Desulfobulbaceae bacterium]|nr:MAG: DNA/RNA nuclease SfsA [Desulfobulbaceae bacterium]